MDAASITHWGGAKSGSPTHNDVTISPSDSICFTREKISTVFDGLIRDRRGLSGGDGTSGTGGDVDVDDDDDDDDDDTSLRNSRDG
jgi:hypothetical protein